MNTLLEKIVPDLLATFKLLHAAPELSYFEKNTARLMADRLKTLDYEVTEQFGEYRNPAWPCHGVVALLRNGPGPTVLFRADMDALPIEEKTGLPYASKIRMKNEQGEEVPVMHACGHDLHCTVLLGIASLMKEMKKKWSGTLMLVVQPAEEVADTGSLALLRAGLYETFPRPDYAIAFHADDDSESGKISYVSGPCTADIAGIEIRVRGMGGHGATPHVCKDPIVLSAQIILALQTIVSREIDPLEPAVVTIGSIHGGTARNVIPEEVILQATIRSCKTAVREFIITAIERICRNLGLAAGLTEDHLPVVSTVSTTPSVYNHPDLIELLVPSFQRALGNEWVESTGPVMGGEDFSWYSQDGRVPTALLWLGIVDPDLLRAHEQDGAPLPKPHSSWYCVTPEPAIRNGVQAMTTAIMDLMKKS